MSAGHFIGGKWLHGSGTVFTSLNPATQQPIWEGNEASAAEVDDAVNAARRAFDGWRKTPLEARVKIAETFKTLLQSRAAVLAECISQDTGKALWDSKTEVQAMLGKVDVSIRAYHARTGASDTAQGAVQQVLRHCPHGVLAVYGPYNFPGHLPNGHIVPALIAGNAIVFKPSEQTPLVAERLVQLWEEAGLPAGVLNLVQGGRETGRALAAHDGIDGLLFTGSAEVGALLHRQFAGRPDKILALEMGGNNPLVVWDVADVEAAAWHILQSAFLTTGQRCTCARRLIVAHGKSGNAAVDALLALTQRITLGGYTETPEPFMGPLISNREAENVLNAAYSLEAAGGKRLLAPQLPRDGLPFITPAVLDVTSVKDRPDREYFGPLLQVIRVENFEAALAEANNTRFGLSAGLLSDDAALYARFSQEVRAGVINWNRPTNGASSALPFGGLGASGNHRPSAFYAADYCAYPVASQTCEKVLPPDIPPQGIRS